MTFLSHHAPLGKGGICCHESGLNQQDVTLYFLKIGALSGGSGDVGGDLAHSRMLTEVPGTCIQATCATFLSK